MLSSLVSSIGGLIGGAASGGSWLSQLWSGVKSVVGSDLFGSLASAALPMLIGSQMQQQSMPQIEMPQLLTQDLAPLPEGQKQESQMSETERQELEDRRRRMAAGQKTVMTTPLGLTEEADTLRPGRRLLGT